METRIKKMVSPLLSGVFSFVVYLILFEDAVNTILIYSSNVNKLPVNGLYLLEAVEYIFSALSDTPAWIFSFLFSPVVLLISLFWFRSNALKTPNKINRYLFRLNIAVFTGWGIKSFLYFLPFEDWKYVLGSILLCVLLVIAMLWIVWSWICLLKKNR